MARRGRSRRFTEVYAGVVYPAPTIASVATNVSPSLSQVVGFKLAAGISLTLSTTGALAGAIVTVNGVACTGVVVTSPTSVSCVTGTIPSEGFGDIVITNFDGQKATLSNGYLALAMRVWLDPNTFTLDGSNTVLQWTDLSGTGNHFAQGSAGHGPVPGTGLNGHASLTHVAANSNELVKSSFSAPSASEVYFVCKNNGPSTQWGLWDFGGGTEFRPFTDGKIYEDFGSSARYDAITPGVTLTNPHVYNVSTATNNWVLRIDGTVISTQGTNTVSFPTNVVIGANAGSVFWDGDAGIFVMASRAHSGPEVTAVTSYLRSIYGI